MPSLKGAYTPRVGTKTTARWPEPIPSNLEGAHEALFIGMSDPYWTYAYQDACKICGGSLHVAGSLCQACDGTGRDKYQEVHLKYRLPNGSEIAEAAKYKISQPFQSHRSGKAISASKLYKRFETFSGLSDVDAIVQWWETRVEGPIPCLVIIKGTLSGKMRISDVLRSRNAPLVAPVYARGPEVPDSELPF